MKTIHRIQYFLFAIILLGMFASFAQNEYSSILLYDPFLFIGLLFFIEMFLYFKESGGNQSSVLYSFFECLALGLFFCGTFLFIMHWSGAVIPVVAGGLVILILYSGVGIKSLVNKAKNEKGMSLMMFCFALASCLAMIACAFTLMHWAMASLLIVASGVFSFIILSLIIFNIKMRQGGEEISLRTFLRQIKTRLVLSFVFFSFWTIYLSLVSFGIAPRLYSLSDPPALEKLYQEQNPAAEVYRNNYQHFIDNWNVNKTNQPEKLSSKK